MGQKGKGKKVHGYLFVSPVTSDVNSLIYLFTLPLISTGNELTPSSKYDFKFKDYAPWVFRHLREDFHIDASDYLVSKQ